MKIRVRLFQLSFALILLFLPWVVSNAHGAGGIGTWNTTTSLPSRLEYPAAVAFDGRLYVLGGYGSPSGLPYSHNDVYMAALNADGSLQGWESTTFCNTGRFLHAAAVDPQTRTMYVIGGVETCCTPIDIVSLLFGAAT